MTSFFKRLFGGGTKIESKSNVEGMFRTVIEGIIEKAALEIDFSLKREDQKVDDYVKTFLHIDFSGSDEGLFTEREGQLMEAFQLYLTRIAQHHFTGENIVVSIDCNQYKETSKNELLETAERIKNNVIEKGKPAYLNAMSPRDRKTVHQFLSSDDRIKSRSIGDGLYKKIKIFPAQFFKKKPMAGPPRKT